MLRHNFVQKDELFMLLIATQNYKTRQACRVSLSKKNSDEAILAHNCYLEFWLKYGALMNAVDVK
jgi:hypothetical protein